MNILYITSGYSKVYRYLDKSVIAALRSQKERNVTDVDVHLPLSDLKSICLKANPDLIFTLLGYKIPEAFFIWLKEHRLPIAVWFTEDPYYIDRSLSILPHVQHAFTIDYGALSFYQTSNYANVSYLPLGTNPDIYAPRSSKRKYRSDICLVGYPYPERVDFINHLSRHLQADITVVGEWRKVPLPASVKVIQRWINPFYASFYYSNSDIVLNTYRSFHYLENKNKNLVENKSLNNRTFEIASCKSFQLTEEKPDLFTHFRSDDLRCFSDKDDLVEKVKYYLANEQERRMIASNGYETAMKNHTFSERIRTIFEDVKW